MMLPPQGEEGGELEEVELFPRTWGKDQSRKTRLGRAVLDRLKNAPPSRSFVNVSTDFFLSSGYFTRWNGGKEKGKPHYDG